MQALSRTTIDLRVQKLETALGKSIIVEPIYWGGYQQGVPQQFPDGYFGRLESVTPSEKLYAAIKFFPGSMVHYGKYSRDASWRSASEYQTSYNVIPDDTVWEIGEWLESLELYQKMHWIELPFDPKKFQKRFPVLTPRLICC